MSIDGIKSRNSRPRRTQGKVNQVPTRKNVVKITTPTSKLPVSARPVVKKNSSRSVQIKSSPVRKKKIVEKKNNFDIEDNDLFLAPVENFDLNFSSDDLTEKKEQKNKGVKKKKKHIVRRVLVVLLILLVGSATAVMVWGNDIISKITGGQSGIFDVISLIQENYVDLKTDSKGRTNVLVFGTSGYNMEGTNGDYAHDGAQLTDTIMVVSLDQETGDVAMLNLPRDLKAGRTCTATGKINEVYWCNNMDGDDEESGAQALIQKVEEILDIEVQYYAHVNWNTLVSVVDTLGGITVTLDEDINDAYYTGVVIEAGVPTTLNGERALGLARARHGTESGDFSRGASQQKILIALKDRILEEGLGVFDAINIINSLGDNVRTNVSLEEIKSGAHLLESTDINSMRQILLVNADDGTYYFTTTMINDISYVVPYAGVDIYYDIQKYVATMLSSDPVVREGSTIEVLNGSDESGVASTEKAKLEKAGFKHIEIGDAPEGEYENLSIYILNEEQVGTKAKLEEYYGVEAKTVEELPEGINSDSDFVVIIGGVDAEE